MIIDIDFYLPQKAKYQAIEFLNIRIQTRDKESHSFVQDEKGLEDIIRQSVMDSLTRYFDSK